MIHVGALPGSPRHREPVDRLARAAADEARVLAGAGFDGLIVENMHDAPYVNGPHGPEIAAAMTRVALEVREAAPELVMGIQVLSMGHLEAVAIAQAAGASFVRVENFVYAHVADEGLLPNATAGELLRYRSRIGAGGVRVFADIKKKHASHAITADLDVADFAHAAEFFGADGLIVTGKFTGDPTSPDDVSRAREAVKGRLPVWVGSGAAPDQLSALYSVADAIIVGSAIKRGGVWSNRVDADRCAAFVAAADRARGAKAAKGSKAAGVRGRSK